MTEPNQGDNERLAEAITALVPPLLNALEALTQVGRQLHPPNLAGLAAAAAKLATPVREGLEPFQQAPWPAHLEGFKAHIEQAADHASAAFEQLAAAARSPNGVIEAFQALRRATRATEALYAVALMLPPVSRFFVEPGRRDDAALAQRLAGANPSRADVGILHASNERNQRGGFTMYVPEHYDGVEPWPLVLALHGGSGHGADFLWTWLREARTRGAILVTPTAQDGTWSLNGRDIDSPRLDAIVEHVAGRWNVNRERVLLTGMSDGGTFCYVSGLRNESPCTHLAPISASFHPMLLAAASAQRMRGLPIYLTHGALDWMFSVDVARTANAALAEAGAKVLYREVEDLSHAYPRDENSRIMDWFLGD